MASRRETLYPEIKHMREVDGLKWKEIAARLGLAIQTVHDYYTDPTNEKHMKRHNRWVAKDFAPCPRCGERLSGRTIRAGGVCMKCHRAIEAAAVLAKLEDVAEMYRSGMPVAEIGRVLGYKGTSKPPEITKCFRMGLLTEADYRYPPRRRRNMAERRWGRAA